MSQALKDIEAGAIVYCSHSGGKDSQAMYAVLRRLVPAEQLVVVHANLGQVEWDGVIDHIKANIDHDLNVVSAAYDFLDMVERKLQSRPDVPSWPSPQYRPCTAALKRAPIQKFIRADMKRRGATLAINAMGLRAEESSARSKAVTWKLNKDLSKAGRTIHDWLPIHAMLEPEVWATIAEAGQQPFWAYADGNKRLSCMFCIMGCKSDLRHAARVNPALAAKYVALEERTGYTMFHKTSLAEIIAPAQRDLFPTTTRSKK